MGLSLSGEFSARMLLIRLCICDWKPSRQADPAELPRKSRSSVMAGRLSDPSVIPGERHQEVPPTERALFCPSVLEMTQYPDQNSGWLGSLAVL
jgi:hypothetical protein